MYVVGRLKGVILHHSSLNFTNLNVLSGGKNYCTPPLICDVKSACSLSFHQPQLFRKMRLWLESQKLNGMRFPSPHCPGDIWCVLTNIAVGYNTDSSITGIKCLECNLEILPHQTEKLLWGKKKAIYLFWVLCQPGAGAGHPWYSFSHREINVKREATFCVS